MKILLLVVAVMTLAVCNSSVKWEEEDYRVYWVDEPYPRLVLGRILENGPDAIRRVEADVIAVGSNDSYIVAKQRDPDDGSISYSIIDKAKDSMYLNMDEITKGPMSEATFIKFRGERNLPEFTVEF